MKKYYISPFTEVYELLERYGVMDGENSGEADTGMAKQNNFFFEDDEEDIVLAKPHSLWDDEEEEE